MSDVDTGLRSHSSGSRGPQVFLKVDDFDRTKGCQDRVLESGIAFVSKTDVFNLTLESGSVVNVSISPVMDMRHGYPSDTQATKDCYAVSAYSSERNSNLLFIEIAIQALYTAVEILCRVPVQNTLPLTGEGHSVKSFVFTAKPVFTEMEALARLTWTVIERYPANV
jgi:hypothetical protein